MLSGISSRDRSDHRTRPRYFRSIQMQLQKTILQTDGPIGESTHFFNITEKCSNISREFFFELNVDDKGIVYCHLIE